MSKGTVKQAEALHARAMERAEEAYVARLQNRDASNLWHEALELEEAAAAWFRSDFAYEPTRSVLFRSAAALALECSAFERAAELAREGLRGHPQKDLEVALWHLLDRASFERHLRLSNLVLEPDDMRLSLAGPAAAPGLLDATHYVPRLEHLRHFVTRMVEYVGKKSFRRVGRPASAVAQAARMLISTPAEASFAVTVRIARSPNRDLPGYEFGPTVIQPMLSVVDAIGKDDSSALEEQVKDAEYRDFFVSLVRGLAPDGEDITFVGLAAGEGSAARNVALDKPRELMGETLLGAATASKPQSAGVPREAGIIEGVLRQADSIHEGREKIALITPDGVVSLRTAPHLVDDIVRPYWGSRVRVYTELRGKTLVARHVEPARETKE